MRQNYDFINKPSREALFHMSLPIMAGMILNTAYNIVDSLWIGNLMGDTALAALTNSTPIINIMFALGMGITSGMEIFLSNHLAENDKQKEESIISSTMIMIAVISIVLVIFVELSLNGILTLMNTKPETFPYAKDYLTIYLIGMIPTFISCHVSSTLRCYGDSVVQMLTMLITSVLNAVLDPILIKVIGFHGAAIATVLAQTTSLLLQLAYCRKKNYFHLNFRAWKKDYIFPVVRLSIPTVIQHCTPSLSGTVLTACVSDFGVTAMAAYGISGKLDTILFMPSMAISMALTPIIGYCAGGGRKDRAADYIKVSLKFSVCLVMISGTLLWLWGKRIAGSFGCSPEVADLVQRCIRFLVWGYLLNSATQCFVSRINGFGQPGKSMMITLLNHGAIRIPLSILLSRTVLGLDGIWLTLLFSFIVSFVCAVIIDRRVTSMPKGENELSGELSQ